MKILRALLSSILVLATVAAVSSAGTYEEGRVYRHHLDNGLTIFTMERHIAPLVYHQLTYRVGSRNERLGITGISHVVEHMMFKGTPRYGKGKASKTISDNAGVFNAFTASDMTSYFEYLPSNKIMLALDIESDRMQNCIFDSKEFASELEVIRQERRMRTESSAQGIMHETMNAIAFDSSPNRDPVIGWPGDLARVTREDAYTYYKTFYTPNNAFLVLVGDFATDTMLAAAKRCYGQIPAGPPVPEMWSTEQPQRVRKTFTIEHNDVSSPSFRFAFHVPAFSDSDAAALKLAGAILCERSRDARLYKRLVEKEKIATSAAGGMPMTRDPGLFNISVSLVPDSSVSRAETIVWEEINRMQNDLVEDRELQKSKNRYKFSQVTDYIKNTDIGSRLSKYEAYYGWDFFPEFDRRVYAVPAEKIRGVMQKYFQPNQVTVGYLQPKPGAKKRAKPAAEPEAEQEPGILQADDVSYSVWNYLAPGVGIEPPGMPADEFVRPRPIAPQVKKATLENGIMVYTIENHLVPAVFVGGLIETGVIPEAGPDGKPGIGAMLANVMSRGTSETPYEELSERMAYVPFTFSIGGSFKSFSFQGYTLTENADEMMSTGVAMVTSPGLRIDDIENVRRRQMIAARDRFKKTGVAAFYHMFRTLFRDHPYTTAEGTEESFRTITAADLKDLHAKYFRPERTSLVVMADMTHEQMRALVVKYFGTWKNNTTAPAIAPLPLAPALAGKQIKVFPEKDYTECTINIGFAPTNEVAPGDEEPVAVLNTILASSALTSRIGLELREKQGLIYGFRSELWAPSDRMGYWKMNTKTAPKNVSRVINGTFSEIRKLLASGVTDEELQRAKMRQLGMLPMMVETPDDVANQVFEMLRSKDSLDWFDHKADRVLAVSSESVMKMARKYLTPDAYVIVVDGPIGEHELDDLIK
jgi:zinc protease